jgi:hypothetical protein
MAPHGIRITLKNLSALTNQENKFSVVRILKHSQNLWVFQLTPWFDCWLDNRGTMVGFLTLARDLFSVAPWSFRGRTQPPVKWLAGAPSLGVKGTGRKVQHSPSPNALVKSTWIYAFNSPRALMVSYWVRHRENSAFHSINCCKSNFPCLHGKGEKMIYFLLNFCPEYNVYTT